MCSLYKCGFPVGSLVSSYKCVTRQTGYPTGVIVCMLMVRCNGDDTILIILKLFLKMNEVLLDAFPFETGNHSDRLLYLIDLHNSQEHLR